MDKSLLRQYAKNMRIQSTNAEQHLWYYLRASRLGFKFKRQFPIDRYIVDFICLKKYLIIELDGSQHFENQHYDMERTQCLQTRGFKILRFWNDEVLRQTDATLEVILHELTNK